MAEEAKAGGGMQRLVLWLVIVALLAMLWVLASERNSRHFKVETANGQLVVEQGRPFPIGMAARQDKVYAPIDLPPGAKPPGELEFDDQNALDQYLFGVWGEWVKESPQKGDTRAASLLIERLVQLPGLTGSEQAELTDLRAGLAWDEAHADVANAGKLLDEARRKLEAVKQHNGVHAESAAALQQKLQSIGNDLAQTVKPAAPAPH